MEESLYHIKLKRAMRFTLCDVCVCTSEVLDQLRSNGGRGWKNGEIEDDHYMVPARPLQMIQLLQAIVRQCTPNGERNMLYYSQYTPITFQRLFRFRCCRNPCFPIDKTLQHGCCMHLIWQKHRAHSWRLVCVVRFGKRMLLSVQTISGKSGINHRGAYC